MAAGKLRAVVCTSTLDLGIDWGDVDLVIHVGAPKGVEPPAAAHRPRQSPARRALAGDPRAGQPLRGPGMPRRRSTPVIEGAQDTPPLRAGALDVLAQHVLGMACAEPFRCRRPLRRGRVAPRPIAISTGSISTAVVDFVATGGYALQTYERYAKIRQRRGRPLARRPSAASRSNTG